jgi:hypothetical protein
VSETIQRLEALLSRIQRNAAELAQARADGSYAASTGSAIGGRGGGPPGQLNGGSEQPFATPALSTPAPSAPAPSSSTPRTAESGEMLAAEPDISDLDDAQIEAELAASESSGAWQAPDMDRSSTDEEHAARRTPPPESGPQVSPSKPPPEFQEVALKAAELAEPSIEQLGGTVDLEPATTGEIEMATPPPEAEPATDDEFEESIPAAERGGVFEESLQPPPTVQDDLAAVDRAEREREVRLSVLPKEVATSMAPDTIAVPPGESPEAATGVLARSPIAATTTAATFEGQRRASTHTFLELLDDSLSLGKN